MSDGPGPAGDPGFDEDYRALRSGVGVVAQGRDVLRVSGADAVEFVQGQLSQDIAAIAVGGSADSLILTPQGKLDALVRVSRTGPDELVIDVHPGFGEMVAARLARFKLRVKVAIEPLAWNMVALRGPQAASVAEEARRAPGTAVAAPFSWNGVSGVDLLGESPAVGGEVRPCSAPAWESVRVEAGIPVMGAELDDRTIPAEADLLDRAVSFTKGCYTGQELVARLDSRGNRVARRLRGLVVGLPSPGVAGSTSSTPAPGSEIAIEGKVVGAVTSSAWSPGLARPVALAYLHRSVEPSSIVEVRVRGPVPLLDSGGAEARDAPVTAVLSAEVRVLPLV